DVLADLEFMDESPRETVIIGVQPVSMETRMELTPEVAARLPEVVGMIVAELRAHGIVVQSRAEVPAH
ncbi:MAG: hydrogenase 2 maturation endopeptidase, partial [Rhodocyclaceae bacterium]|nr:hydrogenase 2 maturation endopeptidase [Rhodocyclaceae bacterium]